MMKFQGSKTRYGNYNFAVMIRKHDTVLEYAVKHTLVVQGCRQFHLPNFPAGAGPMRRLADDACLITSSSSLAPKARLMTSGNLALEIGVKGFGICFLLLSSHLARRSRLSPLVQEWKRYKTGHGNLPPSVSSRQWE